MLTRLEADGHQWLKDIEERHTQDQKTLARLRNATPRYESIVTELETLFPEPGPTSSGERKQTETRLQRRLSAMLSDEEFAFVRRGVFHACAWELAKRYTKDPESVSRWLPDVYKVWWSFGARWPIGQLGGSTNGYSDDFFLSRDFLVAEFNSVDCLEWCWGDVYTLLLQASPEAVEQCDFGSITLNVTN